MTRTTCFISLDCRFGYNQIHQFPASTPPVI